MSDMPSVLAWKLAQLTGLPVFPAPKPAGASLPCITYQIVSDPMQDNNSQGGGSIHMSRVQINHIGDYETVRPIVTTVQNGLEGNRTDFLSCLSDGIYVELPEAEDIWVLSKGYFIQWR